MATIEPERGSLAALRARLNELGPPGQVAVVGLGFLLCVAFSSLMLVSAWSPRVVLLLVALPCGVAALVLLAARRDPAGVAAAGLAVCCVVSALVGGAIQTSLVGQLGKETSALLTVAFLGLWALGRGLDERGRSLLMGALVAGLALNALAAILQVALDVKSGSFVLRPGGRASGLTDSPVRLGALMAGAVGLCAATVVHTSRGRRWWWWLAGAAVAAAAGNYSGTRIALGAMVFVTVVVAGLHRSWRVLLVLAAVAVGVVTSAALHPDGVVSGGGGTSTAVQRTDASSSRRVDAWSYGVDAAAEKPLLGWGPGSFARATQGRFDADFVRATATNEARMPWNDAHNVVVEHLVTVGLLGTCFLLAFVVLAARRARGPLAVLAAGIALTWLLQPPATSTAAVALLALGAAGPAVAQSAAPAASRPRTVAIGALVAVGLVAGLGFAVADTRLDRAVRSGDPARVESAASAFPGDAVAADLVAQAWVKEWFRGLDPGSDVDLARVEAEALRWARRAATREPTRPLWWTRLAALQLEFGEPLGAKVSLARAVELQQWNVNAWVLLAEVAAATGDEPLAELAAERLCTLGLRPCT